MPPEYPGPQARSPRMHNPSNPDRACSTGWCTTCLFKAGCPTCLLIGLVVVPLEAAFRGVRWLLFGGGAKHTDT